MWCYLRVMCSLPALRVAVARLCEFTREPNPRGRARRMSVVDGELDARNETLAQRRMTKLVAYGVAARLAPRFVILALESLRS